MEERIVIMLEKRLAATKFAKLRCLLKTVIEPLEIGEDAPLLDDYTMKC